MLPAAAKCHAQRWGSSPCSRSWWLLLLLLLLLRQR
jgi:hypothetical protein